MSTLSVEEQDDLKRQFFFKLFDIAFEAIKEERQQLEKHLESKGQLLNKCDKGVYPHNQNEVSIDQLLTCDDVAKKYGVKIVTVWAWIRSKKLNAIQIGKAYRIYPEALKEFEATRTTKVSR